MSKRSILTSLVLIACCIAVVAAPAAEVDGIFNVTMGAPYVWRGVEINDEIVVQPEVTLDWDPVFLNLWGTWDLSSDEGTSARTRVDASLGYVYAWERIMLQGGFIFYAYHDDPAGLSTDTYELFLDIMLDYPLSPSLHLFYDIGEIEGAYAMFKLEEAWQGLDWADLVVTVTVGGGTKEFAEAYFAPRLADESGAVPEAQAALLDFRGKVRMEIFLTEEWTIIPSFEYVTLLDTDLKDNAEAAGQDTDWSVLSIGASYKF